MLMAQGQPKSPALDDVLASYMNVVRSAHQKLIDEIMCRVFFELNCLQVLAHEAVFHAAIPIVNALRHGDEEPETGQRFAEQLVYAWSLGGYIEAGWDHRLAELLERHDMPPEMAGRYYELGRRLAELTREFVNRGDVA